MRRTITVYSTRGGSGKTITSLSIAKTLASRGYKTALIDVDLEAPSLIHLIPSIEEIPAGEYWPNFLDVDTIPVSAILKESKFPNLSIIYSNNPEMGKKFLQNRKQSWWETALRRSLEAQLKLYEMGYDFIIFDNQSGLSLNSVNNMILADASILVIRPVNYGVDATKSFIAEMYAILKGIKPRNDYYIWNQVIKAKTEEETELLNSFLNRYNDRLLRTGLEFGCQIPFDRRLNILFLDKEQKTLFELSEKVQEPINKLVDKVLKNLK